jgi:CspA family cold shock protein
MRFGSPLSSPGFPQTHLLIRFAASQRRENTMNEGRIKWYDDKKGYGFITTVQDEDIFLHRSGIKEFGHFGFQRDEPVTFDIKETQQGRQAYNVKPIKAY